MSCSGCSRWAAVRPEMPVPMIAILTTLVFERRWRCGSIDGARQPGAEEGGAARERGRGDAPVARDVVARGERGDAVDGVGQDAARQPQTRIASAPCRQRDAGADHDVATP